MGTRRTHLVNSDPAAASDWRRARLEQAGFERALSRTLALDRRTDVHALLELVDRGCPPHLAARILAPLDDAEAASR